MRILMLEDDTVLAELVGGYLSRHFRVDIVSELGDALAYIERYRYSVVLLDRNINGVDVGMSLIEKIKQRSSETGVIIISAYDAIAEKIAGLNLGADDYLDKPFDNAELLARVHALARRNQGTPHVEVGGLTCDMLGRSIRSAEEEIVLSRKENDLFFYLLSKQGQIISKDELLDALYVNPQNIASNTIDATVKNVRKKLPKGIIKTVKTRGYVIERG
ncbi:response regulator transcription factor [Sulfurimonas diazotrophicus]|uniref:Response regulator transcription factor n=1 Tax=Sulfurimonas diazotrophicus TaxID=3131939 RepID=A0ABZ3HCB3_9BACT